MAETQQAHGPPTGGKRRTKKMSTRVDMTPMVDLAFLLLTFFMLTTTFAKPSVMQLQMPVKDEPTPVSAQRALTIILGKGHRVHYFFGLNAPNDHTVPTPEVKTTTFAANGIRQVLLARQQATPPIILIKPSAGSKYQDMVDILDEMNITNQKKYALVRITPADLTLIPPTVL